MPFHYFITWRPTLSACTKPYLVGSIQSSNSRFILFLLALNWYAHTLIYLLPSKKFWVAMMLTHQPLFVLGIEDLSVARSSAFGSCYMYCFTFGVSVVMIYQESQKKWRERISARQRREMLPMIQTMELAPRVGESVRRSRMT
jgi:hypothetical protein